LALILYKKFWKQKVRLFISINSRELIF